MREPKREAQLFSLDGGLETDALNLQFLDKTFGDALDHVVDEGAAQAVQGLGLGVVALAADQHVAALEAGRGAGGQLEIELALGAFDPDLLALDLHFDLRRHGHR